MVSAWRVIDGYSREGLMTMTTHMLVVDNDPLHTKLLRFLLEDHGYGVSTVADPREVLRAMQQEAVDLVLLAVALPSQDRFSLCAQLKHSHGDIPVVILSERHQPEDLVHGFSQGADDYLIRPYEPAELLARVQAVLRRYRRVERNRYGVLVKVGSTSLDLGRLIFRGVAGQEVVVTPTEMRVLECLMRNAHTVMPRERLIEQTWGYDSESADNRVDVYIRRLRNKLEAQPRDPQLIRTIRGVGYIYEGEQAIAAIGAD